MFNFAIHPYVYSSSHINGLRKLLEETWIRNLSPGDGTIFIISGFSNYNGGARFYKRLKEHTENGGKIFAILGGSSSKKLSSKQVVEALLECGAQVFLINRKRILHAKCYGYIKNNDAQSLIVSSGNFTGPGMSQNIEASVLLDERLTANSNFDWISCVNQLLSQDWQYFKCNLDHLNPCWNLLYDESARSIVPDDSELETMIITLQPTDTNRIQASSGDRAGLGSQYFWLSKDCFDFFPPLTIKNERGWKGTLSTLINLNYIDLGRSREERVTFEAENNLDFRLGTGLLRYTKIASPEDLACLTRINDTDYELRIINKLDRRYQTLRQYAHNFIGNRGKQYGFIDNLTFGKII
ncbi:phospholipase D-like domain-containing protein [Xenorhabdus thuongxuanensis]|uniref:Uncharacterized protein n=2 Tax=Xenorhabdus thuongxuanensis TaxID=1873484 RepID=A0A1Q5U2L1_9GAMM|nr:phospholipase D-like domain-containing protein [Xenorhabdus thuongxuanensis]OKP06726.1 hypothetical protein Xentx_01852 [Xenorhabdus thuongxuanensis]